MANKQISQLTTKPVPVASTDQFGIDDNTSQSYKITVAMLQTYFNGLFLALAGGTMTGNLVLAGDPTSNLMAATKQYVDSLAAGLNVQPSCRMASTTALTVTYNNGSSGVGATLTNAGAQAALTLDGVAAVVGNRVLIKNQASTFQNGIYTVTNIGSGASNWVLTRATDYDTSTEITPGDFVLVLSGTANGQTQWVQTATVATVGTDPIVWDQFGADITAVITAIQNSSYVYSEDTGAADAYVATLSPPLAAYVEGTLVILDVANANTGASTVNVNGLGVKNIVTEQNGTLLAGDMVAGRRAWLLYDGTSFRLVNRNIERRLQNDSFNYILDTGAADAYVATIVPALTAYVAGQRLSLKIANANTTTTPTVNVNGLGAKTIKRGNGTPLVAGDLPAGLVADLRYDGTDYLLLNPAGLLLPAMVSQGRLTLTTNVPVTVSDATAATTVYYTPFTGNKVSLWTGTYWSMYTFTELSIAVPATTSQMYDVFLYLNSGVPALELLAWTNDTTRATAIGYTDGVLTKAGDKTRKYLGSMRTTTVSGQTEDSIAKRYLFNNYNRVKRPMRVLESTDSWSYSTAAYRQANASTANQLDFIQGTQEDAVQAWISVSMTSNAASGYVAVAIGVNSTTVKSSSCVNGYVTGNLTQLSTATASFEDFPQLGRQTMTWLEYGSGANTQSWYGDNGATVIQSGIHGIIMG